jgi:tRNA A-37 threonylcarbamoyl transferase component Bud32
MREQRGILALHAAGIHTPALLYAGELSDKTPVLITEQLDAPETALEVWNSLTTDSSRQLVLKKLLYEIAKHHNAGLFQRDLHLGNFLLSQKRWYTIDGDTINVTSKKNTLRYKTSLDNLALFFAQLEPRFDHLLPAATHDYAQLRGLDAKRMESELPKKIYLTRKRRRLAYVKKSFRNCSEFVRNKTRGQVVVARRDADPELVQRLSSDPDSLIRQGELLKDGNSATVVRININQREWVIKRYNIKNFIHGVKRSLRPTRAKISWGNAQRLRISGIDTPRATAMLEKRFGPIRSIAYYVCEYSSGTDATKYFNTLTYADLDDNEAACNLVALFTTLRRIGVYHGDCKATNFLISHMRPLVIDLDAMREFRSYRRYLRRYRSDRARFLRNWPLGSELRQWFDSELPK